MQWTEIRRTYPGRWLLVEALAAYSHAGKRMIEDLTVVDAYPDGMAAMTAYKELHRQEPGRELYVAHTDRESLDIDEIHWFGIHAASALEDRADIEDAREALREAREKGTTSLADLKGELGL